MPNWRNALPWLLLAAALFLLVRRGAQTPPIPRIVTIHDTVTRIDTQWITRLTHDTVTVYKKQNIVERITVTKPVFVKLLPQIAGLTALSVPQKTGDSTLAYGFRVMPSDSGYNTLNWQYQYWTPGPLRSLTVGPSGATVASFYDPPATCNLKCKGEWAAGGAVVITILRGLLGH
jgi:hypothetical protein